MSRPISAAYLERKLRSLSGVAGKNPLPDLEDLKGLIVLENDRPEWSNPAGENLCAGVVQFIAVAAQLMTARLRNPDNSGVLAIVERVSAASGAASQVRASEAYNPGLVVDLGTLFATKVNRDPRGRDNTTFNVTACILSGVTNAIAQSVGIPFAQMICPGNTQVELVSHGEPLVIPPGGAVDVDFFALNTPENANFYWRERPLEGDFDLR